MADILTLSSRIIDSGSDEGERTNRTTCELSVIAAGIAMVEAFGHVIAFETDEGLVIFDTSSQAFASRAIDALREWSARPFHTIVYTHGHVDHVGGARAFVEHAVSRGEPRPRIVAHRNVARRFGRYDATNGYNAVINARQFGPTRLGDFKQPRFMSDFVAPGVEYDSHMSFRAGALEFELHHALGETDDHTWAWIPSRRVICSGDLLTWVFPNAGNPQKVQRYPLEWARALRDMIALEPDLLLPAHGLPIAGNARIRKVLNEVASALEHLVEETLRRMNAGQRLDSIVNEVRPPEDVLERPWLKPVYDEPEFVVRNIWRLYGGWYEGNPAHLKPAPDVELSHEIASLAGGAIALAHRAAELSESGDHRLACHLAEFAGLAEPDNGDIQAIRSRVYEARAANEVSLMARGIFRSAALEPPPGGTQAG